MNNLQELLNPNSVRFIKLENILNYEQPTKYIVKNTNYSNNFSIPVLTAGKNLILGFTNEIEGVYKASIDSPCIIFDDFTTSFHWIEFYFKIKSSAIKILKPRNDIQINFKYIYYIMKNISYFPAEHSRQWISKYSKLLVPIPSLERQNYIVKTLDKFTELQTELQTELGLRKKQYEYYRNKLLSFENEAVQWQELGGVVDIDKGVQLNKANMLKDGNYPVFNGGINPSGYFDDYNVDKNTIIISQGGASAGYINFIKTKFWASAHCFIVRPKIKNADNKFVYYFLKSNQDFTIMNLKQGSGIPNLYKNDLLQIKIPIPSLKRQKQIVEFLDRLDKLVNDLQEGLPLEIELRKKQYEYYQHELLSFDKAG